jgi:hypothetical protein
MGTAYHAPTDQGSRVPEFRGRIDDLPHLIPRLLEGARGIDANDPVGPV